MSTIQIRNVPDDFHRRLKARAAENGQSLSDYLLDELRLIADRPTLREWGTMVLERDGQRRPAVPAAEVLADERRR
ncbi:hypothetical protein [Paraconexibacter sp.]|uniref:FitA-like ribbon-helix-helix domain-containing protein n=1 Tax=Paraconexibacter sp. TaxID=2949640 RepID=UPI003564009D